MGKVKCSILPISSHFISQFFKSLLFCLKYFNGKHYEKVNEGLKTFNERLIHINRYPKEECKKQYNSKHKNYRYSWEIDSQEVWIYPRRNKWCKGNAIFLLLK